MIYYVVTLASFELFDYEYVDLNFQTVARTTYCYSWDTQDLLYLETEHWISEFYLSQKRLYLSTEVSIKCTDLPAHAPGVYWTPGLCSTNPPDLPSICHIIVVVWMIHYWCLVKLGAHELTIVFSVRLWDCTRARYMFRRFKISFGSKFYQRL